MDYQSLHMKTVADLRKLAKEMGVRVPAGTKKNVLIDLLLESTPMFKQQCDVNGDGALTIGDVSALIDKLLSAN